MSRAATAAALLALVAGCIEGELEPRSLVQQWRVLAVVAEPPTTQPGDDVEVRALVVDPSGERVTEATDGIDFVWRVCVRAEQAPGLSGLQYSPSDPSEACGAADPRLTSVLEATGEDSARVPGRLTELLFENLESAAESFGEELPPEIIEAILSTVGLQLTVELAVLEDGEERVVAYKRLIVVDGDVTGTNPPPPRFRIDGTWVDAANADASFTCATEAGTPVQVAADTEVLLEPDPDDDAWRETYFVIDITGEVVPARERPFYSWFSTEGSFDQEVTRAPVREELWVTPAEPGIHPLWLVVRDGHGGTSACEAQVEVIGG